MRRVKLCALLAVFMLSACSVSGTGRTAPLPVLAEDYFDGRMPSSDRVFIYTAKKPPQIKPSFIYLVNETPKYLSESRRAQYDDAVRTAVRKLGFDNIRGTDEVNDLLRKHKIETLPINVPSEGQLKQLQAAEGPFLTIMTQYQSIVGSRIAYIVHVHDPVTSSVLLHASYDTVVWNDVPKELIYPIFNVFGNWYRDQITYKPAK